MVMIKVKSFAKEAIKLAIDIQFHHQHAKDAGRILKAIEASKGRTPAASIKLSNDYAVDVLGHKHFAPWLYVYCAVSGGFREGWIPDNYYGSIVVPALKGFYGKISSLKPLNSAFFKSDVFPDIAAFVNGIFLDRDYQQIAPANIKKILFANAGTVVFKLDNSLQGKGIYFFSEKDFDVNRVWQLGNGVFQGFIQQHQLFSAFAEKSVATLRITSVFQDDGEISVRACYLRFGNGDDTHVQSSSHIRVPIDTKTGGFNEKGYLNSWLETDAHPTSKQTFAGNNVPAFSKCISTVKDLHRKVPYVRTVGWDVTVDQTENVKVMEWNGEHNDIKFSEATQGPCFSDLGWEKLKPRRFSYF
jgi:hypothetical protein